MPAKQRSQHLEVIDEAHEPHYQTKNSLQSEVSQELKASKIDHLE